MMSGYPYILPDTIFTVKLMPKSKIGGISKTKYGGIAKILVRACLNVMELSDEQWTYEHFEQWMLSSIRLGYKGFSNFWTTVESWSTVVLSIVVKGLLCTYQLQLLVFDEINFSNENDGVLTTAIFVFLELHLISFLVSCSL